VGREVQVARIKVSRFAQRVAQHADLQVVDHDLLRATAKKFQRMPVAREELLHRLRKGKLQIHHPL